METVVVGRSSARDHIGCARADRRRTGKRLQAVLRLRIGRRDMHHGLLVAGLIVAELRHLLQRLANPSNIAMSKNTEASSEKGLFSPVAFYILVVEKGNDGLGHRHTLCCLLVHIRSPIIKKPTRVNP